RRQGGAGRGAGEGEVGDQGRGDRARRQERGGEGGDQARPVRGPADDRTDHHRGGGAGEGARDEGDLLPAGRQADTGLRRQGQEGHRAERTQAGGGRGVPRSGARAEEVG